MDLALITTLLSQLVVWLVLRAGLSRTAAGQSLKALDYILSLLLKLVATAIENEFHAVIQFTGVEIPQDIRAAYSRLGVNPEITQTAVCPKCFTPVEGAAEVCSWRETPRSRPCGTQLLKPAQTRSSATGTVRAL